MPIRHEDAANAAPAVAKAAEALRIAQSALWDAMAKTTLGEFAALYDEAYNNDIPTEATQPAENTIEEHTFSIRTADGAIFNFTHIEEGGGMYDVWGFDGEGEERMIGVFGPDTVVAYE